MAGEQLMSCDVREASERGLRARTREATQAPGVQCSVLGSTVGKHSRCAKREREGGGVAGEQRLSRSHPGAREAEE